MSTWSNRIRLLTGPWFFLLLAAVVHSAPALAVSPAETPFFEDDMELQHLGVALTKSLASLHKVPASSRYAIAGQMVPVQRLIDSALHLQQLVQSHLSTEELNRRLNQEYDRVQVSRPSEATPKRMLITGYYQPIFSGSLKHQPPYLYPLYRIPDDLLIRQEGGKKKVLGRKDKGRIAPYWTRQEIERGQLLHGQELVWLKDPFDAFVLHVQGSGIIRLADGSVRGVHYAVNNGRDYRSIGKYLVDTGRMQLADVTMDSIRHYIDQHPDERDLILHQNDSFIFFHWSQPGPAIGNLGQELTPGRSIAADQRWYPPGSLVFLDSRRPVVVDGQVAEWQQMRRLVTVQDTGAALTGPERIDVFWGTGEQAGQEAGQMKEDGEAYLLLLKEGVRE